jgi:hypothetical protein
VATLLENLITRRNAIGVELAALGVTKAGGLPNTSGAGAGVDHVGYKDGLYRELAEINKLIAEQRASGDGTPWEFEQAGF